MMDEEYYPYIKKWFKKEAKLHSLIDIPISWMRNKIVDFINAKEGSKILDVATGTGGQVFAFAKKGYDVVGIDLSKDMIREANRKNIYENLKLKVADATNLPFGNNHFDVSCISLALHDMPLTIREKTLQEMARVTKPKGIIVILDYLLPKSRIMRTIVYHLIRSYETKYYLEYIKHDLRALLKKHKIIIEKEFSLIAGAILKCINVK